MKQGNDQAAVEHFIKIVNMDASHARSFHNLGVLHSKHGQVDNAKEFYKLSINADASLMVSANNLAVLIKDKGTNVDR